MLIHPISMIFIAILVIDLRGEATSSIARHWSGDAQRARGSAWSGGTLCARCGVRCFGVFSHTAVLPETGGSC